MRVVLRADAGDSRGTGHVMRCLTLGEGLLARGHDVTLLTGGQHDPWLREMERLSGIVVLHCPEDSLYLPSIEALSPDWVVVDSYWIDPSLISSLNTNVPVLAIVDGDTRGMDAALYLDQNLGSTIPSGVDQAVDRWLLGPSYALVRRSIISHRRDRPWVPRNDPPRILAFMGGTDPTHATEDVARALAATDAPMSVIIVAPQDRHEALGAMLRPRTDVMLIPPTPSLPDLLADADLVISAAGTSAWDVCALGIPSILVAVVDNQVASLRAAFDAGLALGIDASDDRSGLAPACQEAVTALLDDEKTRAGLSERCRTVFDGKGTDRVVDSMEQHLR